MATSSFSEQAPSQDLWRTELNSLAQAAFEAIDLSGYEVADKLRDMQWESERFKRGDEALICKGVGVFFAYPSDEPDAPSQKMSFHVEAQMADRQITFNGAYVYDTRTGNEVATLFELKGY